MASIYEPGNSSQLRVNQEPNGRSQTRMPAFAHSIWKHSRSASSVSSCTQLHTHHTITELPWTIVDDDSRIEWHTAPTESRITLLANRLRLYPSREGMKNEVFPIWQSTDIHHGYGVLDTGQCSRDYATAVYDANNADWSGCFFTSLPIPNLGHRFTTVPAFVRASFCTMSLKAVAVFKSVWSVPVPCLNDWPPPRLFLGSRCYPLLFFF